jgi:hypothetical protein
MASGTAAARISPTAKAAGNFRILMIQKANIGIITNCAKVPRITSLGFSTIGLKSLVESRHPIPNIVKAKSQSVKDLSGVNTCGKRKPTPAAKTTHTTNNRANFSNNLFNMEKNSFIFKDAGREKNF